jgi:hypothetical protein
MSSIGLKPDESGNEELRGMVLQEVELDNHRYTRVGTFKILGVGRIVEFFCARSD